MTFSSRARRTCMRFLVATTCALALSPAPPAAALEAVSKSDLDPCEKRFAELQEAPFDYIPRSLIATLPDPVASPFAREFDILFLALQQGMAHEGFVQDVACLTWSQAAKPAVGSARPLDAAEQPSVVLFRREEGMAPDDRSSVPEVYAVLLVGELPHTGVRSRAMSRALELVGKGRTFAAAPDEADPADTAPPVRILGPSFSGSARSLAVALRGHQRGGPPRLAEKAAARASEPPDEPPPALGSITLRSGTATDGGLNALFEKLLPGAVSFASLGTSNDDLQRCVWNRLVPERLGLRTRWKPERAAEEAAQGGPCAPTALGSGDDNSRVALLVESSVYGRDFEKGGFHVVPFPTHIGALRDAYQKIDERSRQSGAEQTAPEVAATLPFVAAGGSLQGLPAFGQHATLSSQDLVLNRSLRQLARRRTQVVAIIATNTADKLFLAEKVRTFAPDARLITFEGDVLLGHPSALPTTGGMLVASSSPLEEPDPFLPEAAAGAVQLLFDFDGAQGVYRAVIDLVSAGDQRPPPQVVVSVVAKKGLLALDRYAVGEGRGGSPRDAGASADSAATPGGGLVGSGLGGGSLRLTPAKLPMLWSLILLLASLLLGLVAWAVLQDLRAGRALLGLVPVDLVAPRRWGRPQSGDRMLHALVVLFPLCSGLPYFVLAVPALARESGDDAMLIAGLRGTALGYLVNACLALLAIAVIYLLAGLAVRTWHDARALRRSTARNTLRSLTAQARVAVPLAFVVVCTLLALYAGRLCIERLWTESGSAGSLLVARTLSLSGGVSPLLPAILMAAVVLGWALLVLRRREELDRICPERDEAHLLPTPDPASRLLRARYGRLWAAVDPLGDGRTSARWWVLLVAVPVIYLSSLYGQLHFAAPLRGIEGGWFDRGMSVLFLLILMLLVAAGVSLFQGWLTLRDFVVSAAELVDGARLKPSSRPPSLDPLRDAFARLAGRAPKETAALRARLVAESCGTGTLWLQVVLWLRGAEAKAKSRQAAVEAAENYAAAGAAFMVRQAYRQLRQLMIFVTVSLIALFFAVSSYAFEPRRVLLVYLGLLMVLAALVCVWIVVQAGRDELLGRLAGLSETAGGWVPLTQRLSLFAGLPALSLLAGRFPELRQILGDWVEPLVNALR